MGWNVILVSFFILFQLVAPPAGARETVFRDDFRGVERIMPDLSKKLYPDHTKWAFTFWPGTVWPDSYGDGTNWLEGNGECQTYVTPWIEKIKGDFIPAELRYDPFDIREDGLHITADVLSPAQMKAYKVSGARMFGSGLLKSRFAFQYGEVTMVAKLPSARGSWPAFWLLSADRQWPPEMDPMEAMVWGPHKTQIHSGIKTKGDRETFGQWFDIGVNPSENFHEYKMVWTKETITMYFDGKELFSRPTPPSMHQKMYILINLAVGGQWPYNELGIKPIDSLDPERLLRGSETIKPDYPATMIVKSVEVRQ